jgi:hypothetical protein
VKVYVFAYEKALKEYKTVDFKSVIKHFLKNKTILAKKELDFLRKAYLELGEKI